MCVGERERERERESNLSEEKYMYGINRKQALSFQEEPENRLINKTHLN